MKIIRELLRDSAIYGGGDLVAKLVAFATLPLLASTLGPAGFGTLDLALTVALLGGVAARCGLNSAVQRYYWDTEVGSSDQPDIVSTGLMLTCLLGILAACAALVLVPWASSRHGLELSLTTAGLAGLVMILAAGQWAQYCLDVLRLHFRPWRFMAYSLLYRVAAALLAVAVVVLWHEDANAALLAQGAVTLLCVPLGIALIRRDVRLPMTCHWSGPLMAFGLPLMLAELAYWLFSSIDRWMLASLLGVDAVGVYSVAFRFSMIAGFVATAFGMAWSPYSMKLRRDAPEVHRQIYAEVLLALIAIMSLAAGVLGLFAGEILGVLMTPSYAGSAIPLVILCFCVVLQATQQITGIGISLAKRTGIFAWMIGVAAGLNALLNWWWIPLFGVAGAAWGTLVAYAFLSVSYLWFTQRLYPLPLAWGRMTWLLCLAAVLLGAGLVLQSSTPTLPMLLFKIGIVVVFLICAVPALKLRALGARPATASTNQT